MVSGALMSLAYKGIPSSDEGIPFVSRVLVAACSLREPKWDALTCRLDIWRS